jgi:hypothetical protein
VVNSATASQVLDGATPTTAYSWTFVSNTFGDDSPKTFTVEQGSSFRAHRAANCILKEYTVKWSREEITLDGSWLAKAIEDGVTLTSSPTQLPQIPVKPADLSVYIDATSSTDLGTTKMTRVLKGEFSIADRYDPLWVVDAAQPSFVDTVEGEPKVTMKITQMADAAAMANLTRMRNGQTVWIRLEGVGPTIYTPGSGPVISHRMTIDMAAQVMDIDKFSDEDGVFAINWTFGAVHDPVYGKAFSVKVITTTTAL